MLRYIKALGFTLFISLNCTLSAQAAESLPTRIQVVYEVTKNGQPFAKVHEQFVVSNGAYKIESVTKGIGVYALFGTRTLTSNGEVITQGLKPSHFELHQGDNAKKTLLADFDWTKQILQMTVKGSTKEAPLSAATQDLASYAYQFMFMPTLLKDAISITLTTGKKLNQYQYRISSELESIESAGVQYKSLHLVQTNQTGTDTKELWLATEHHHLPVRIMMVDDNGQKLEQKLIELEMQ